MWVCGDSDVHGYSAAHALATSSFGLLSHVGFSRAMRSSHLQLERRYATHAHRGGVAVAVLGCGMDEPRARARPSQLAAPPADDWRSIRRRPADPWCRVPVRRRGRRTAACQRTRGAG
jgi:hypothetical protein